MSLQTHEQLRAEFDAEVEKAYEQRNADALRDLIKQLPEDADEEAESLEALALAIETYDCPTCQDERGIEILGDGDNFEVDVIGYKPCPDCKYVNPIQD